MEVYRLTKVKYPDALDTSGAKQYGGRFNSRGTEVIYAASSRALAVLEMRVHASTPSPSIRILHIIEVPDENIQTIKEAGLTLPPDWNDIPPQEPSMRMGDAWVRKCSSVGLLVPSVVIPAEYNLVINPKHPEFANVVVRKSTKIDLDRRLWLR